MGLTKVTVIIKGYGAGFTQPADGIRYNDPVSSSNSFCAMLLKLCLNLPDCSTTFFDS